MVASPRQILRRQLDRLAERGWVANAGTELEFILFRDTYEQAWHKGFRDLEPANLYNVDYSLLGTARVEPLIRRIRNEMAGAGLTVENSKGECNFGQHEINFRYSDALTAADAHALYKTGAKEIAAQEGMAITFMAKYDEREGNSCHIHLSLAREDGSPLFADEQETFDRFVAGQLAALRELTLFFAPNINSYKRFAAGSFAPTAVAWGRDNRTCAMRVVGHGAGAASREPDAGRRREPVPRAGGHDRRGPRRDRPRARAAAAVRGQRLHRRPRARARQRCATRATCSPRASWRARRSARRSWTTTSTTRASSWPRSSRPSRTGSACAGSSGCNADGSDAAAVAGRLEEDALDRGRIVGGHGSRVHHHALGGDPVRPTAISSAPLCRQNARAWRSRLPRRVTRLAVGLSAPPGTSEVLTTTPSVRTGCPL